MSHYIDTCPKSGEMGSIYTYIYRCNNFNQDTNVEINSFDTTVTELIVRRVHQ
jgi:hypothetical protein